MAVFIAVTAGIAWAQAPSLKPDPDAPPASTGLVAAAPPAIAGGHDLNTEDVDAWLDGYMPYALRSGDIAGAVVTVVKDGRVIAAKGYGYADVVQRRPVDPARTLFRPGSVSKLMTWTAVMQLVGAGKIDLDADVNKYLDFQIPPRGGRPVTMRQIMTHTAGFEETVKDLIAYNPKSAMPLGQYLKRWVPRRIFDPGTTPAYSNWATTVAGYVVERVSGETFENYVEKHIFIPLDMRTASFRQPLPAALVPLVATGYPRASAPAKGFEFVIPAPAGGLSASGLDMAKFMAAHLKGGKGVLEPASAGMMHNSPLNRVDPMSLIPPLNRMELGFFETGVNGRDVIGHLGDTENFHTSLYLFMKEGVGFYVSFNSAGREGGARVLRRQLLQDFADRYFPATDRDGQVDAVTAARHAKAMVGLWISSRRSESSFLGVLNLFGQTRISIDAKGGLVVDSLKGPGGAVRQWDEISPFVWRARYGSERLAAKVVDGQVVRWSSDGFSPFMMFDRVPASISSAWLLPAICFSLSVLVLTFLYWPATWFIRRRYASPLKVGGAALNAYRATRIMSLLVLIVASGWAWFIVSAFSDLDRLSSNSDWILWLLQIAGAIIFVGAVGIAGWNAWLTWRGGRRWAARIWSILIFLSASVALYTAAEFGLLSMTVNY
ncbi:serine hydrolase domain-containing protein [Sphingopyxis sp.]|uniref:serine hydrolase domain-containing protein n=1 Tax=Sphingopyxis sp. TaxID=1908224 RepID=UPI002FCA511D